jgi:hypothetical protein
VKVSFFELNRSHAKSLRVIPAGPQAAPEQAAEEAAGRPVSGRGGTAPMLAAIWRSVYLLRSGSLIDL